MFEVITGEASKGYKKKNIYRTIKIVDKYANLNRFHHDYRIQVYMYDFMYVDPDTMPVEEHFTATKKYAVNYKKMSTPGPVQKYWFEFSYIPSKYYELYLNFSKHK